MNRVELARKVAAEHDLSQAEAERVLKTIVETLIDSPVAGLRPLREARFTCLKVPKPTLPTSPRFLTVVTMVRAKKIPKFIPGAPFKALVAEETGKAK